MNASTQASKYAYASALHSQHDVSVRDRILERYFPDARAGELQGPSALWVILDREGNVLRTGRESAELAQNSMSLRRAVISNHFPELRFNETSMGTLKTPDGRTAMDKDGKPVIVTFLWLSEYSPLPGSWATN